MSIKIIDLFLFKLKKLSLELTIKNTIVVSSERFLLYFNCQFNTCLFQGIRRESNKTLSLEFEEN